MGIATRQPSDVRRSHDLSRFFRCKCCQILWLLRVKIIIVVAETDANIILYKALKSMVSYKGGLQYATYVSENNKKRNKIPKDTWKVLLGLCLLGAYLRCWSYKNGQSFLYARTFYNWCHLLVLFLYNQNLKYKYDGRTFATSSVGLLIGITLWTIEWLYIQLRSAPHRQ